MDIKERTARNLERLMNNPPLVHHITNWVTISECASMTRSLGAYPVMAHAVEEVEEMVNISGALVLNIGTLTPELVESMIKAGRQANAKGVRIVLDAVGAGATKLRTESTRKILDSVKVSVVKGNAGEIATIAGAQAEVRGVESISVDGDPAALAEGLAKAMDCVVAVTAPVDIVTDGRTTYLVKNGHPRMGEVVGTGCMSASVIGSFAGTDDDLAAATAGALSVYGIAGEDAAARASGPGTMKMHFFDTIASIGPDDVRERADIEIKK